MSGTQAALSPEQADALFDVLTHYETYREIEDFKSPSAISEYGPPFQDNKKSSSPILQSLVAKFALQLPGLRDVSPDFWKVRVENIIKEFSSAELSESYDKGVLGIRKTLATAFSALIEYPARGILGGFPKQDSALKSRSYDKSNADDVLAAWNDFLQQLVYGDLFDALYAKAGETDDLSQHGELTQAAHEFIVVNLASFLHYTIVLSPEGPALLRMLENVHKLAPYVLIRQTLRIGNVATMINGMVKLLLAKVSIGSITNWIGVSSGADEGMNLLQQIISTVLGWDRKELKKRTEKIEKDKHAPSKEVREALKEWMNASREEHLQTRKSSRDQNMSIVTTILSLSPVSAEMSDEQHTLALEYLCLQLGIRDRKEIIDVLCHHNPDHLTIAIRDGVSAYEPMIRQIHQAVDLSATVADFQAFMDDMIKLSKQDKGTSGHPIPPSVEDFVTLLHNHQNSSHKFLHQVVKNSKEISQWFLDYCHKGATYFQQDNTTSKATPKLSEALVSAYSKLEAEKQSKIRAELDAHSKYLSELHSSSASRIKDVINNDASVKTDQKKKKSKSGTPYGPGAYLARWQQLLDCTLITPAKQHGPVRTGASMSVKEDSSKDVDGQKSDDVGVSEEEAEKRVKQATPEAPSTETTIEALGGTFRTMLQERL